MLRLSGKLLAALALAAHAALVVPGFHRTWFDRHSELGLFLFLVVLPAFCLGRVALSFLPPGSPGSHTWQELPATLAASFALGFPIMLLLACIPGWTYWSWFWVFLLAAATRWLTLPGAMVPRHPPRSIPPTWLDLALIALGTVWGVHLVLVGTPLAAWGWFALSLLVFHGLRTARRDRLGGFWLLGVLALLGAPPAVADSLDDFGPAFLPALALGAGGTFSVAWLRRADRRAGVLAATSFASVLAESFDPLALAGLATLISASRRPQRPFVLRTSIGAALVFAVPAWLAGDPFQRGRWLRARELVDRALDWQDWGLAWPLVTLALVLGAASFPWREEAWSSASIEEPRREVRALARLVVLAALALALPISPWGEPDALVILFPPLALLAGLLALPAERPNPTPSPAPAGALAGAGTSSDR